MPSTLSPLSPLSLDSVALQPPLAYAAAVDQLSQTVQQLLLAALARARQMELPALPDPALAALPARPPAAAPRATAVPALSSREEEVLRLIAAGDSNKMIARALDLSPHTVKRHVANILDKLDLRSRGQAAAWWMARQPQRQGH